jgi:hypothetical protein
MSGMEVAGLVFGVIPIAIEVYKVYQETSKPMFKYSEVMNSFVREMHTAHARLQNSLTKLLHDLVDEPILVALLNGTNASLWKDPILDRHLHDRLDVSYFGYFETIKCIRHSLHSLESLVGLDDLKSKVRQFYFSISAQLQD